MNQPLFYQDKPLFGFDIGHDTIKAVQLDRHGDKIRAVGYGYNTFNGAAIRHGVIHDMEAVATAVNPLVTQLKVGHFTTNRVAISIPASRSFTRVLTLPYMEDADLAQAVRLEAEQYIPVPTNELYVDYERTAVIEAKAKQGQEKEKQIEVVMVAAPKKIVDSYMDLCYVLGLEPALFETSLNANARSFLYRHRTNKPIMLIDFGARSADLNVFDGKLRVAGTVEGGGEGITDALAKSFAITQHQAYILKTRYGLKAGPKQKEIKAAIVPLLNEIIKEINKMVRYYKDRESNADEISAIVISGGGANLPGLTEYLTEQTKIKALVDDPWENLDLGRLQQPHKLEGTIYTTAVGLALAGPGVMRS